jgi:hypothetical protein
MLRRPARRASKLESYDCSGIEQPVQILQARCVRHLGFA